jgi:hypothetical protein
MVILVSIPATYYIRYFRPEGGPELQGHIIFSEVHEIFFSPNKD